MEADNLAVWGLKFKLVKNKPHNSQFSHETTPTKTEAGGSTQSTAWQWPELPVSEWGSPDPALQGGGAGSHWTGERRSIELEKFIT